MFFFDILHLIWWWTDFLVGFPVLWILHSGIQSDAYFCQQKKMILNGRGLSFSQTLGEASGKMSLYGPIVACCNISWNYFIAFFKGTSFAATLNYTWFRDIMDALSNIGDIVKAAQFVGQSSGLFFTTNLLLCHREISRNYLSLRDPCLYS